MECPILVWMLSLNRDVTTEVCVRCSVRAPLGFVSLFVGQEYDKCFNLVRECAPHARIAYDCTSIESFREFLLCMFPSFRVHLSFRSLALLSSARRLLWLVHAGQVISQMLPLLMMRHRRISRTKWKDCETSNGKHWIEQVCLSVHSLHPLRLTCIAKISLIILSLFASSRSDASSHPIATPHTVTRRHATRKVSPVDDRIPSRLRQLVVWHGHDPRPSTTSRQHRSRHQTTLRRTSRGVRSRLRRIVCPQGPFIPLHDHTHTLLDDFDARPRTPFFILLQYVLGPMLSFSPFSSSFLLGTQNSSLR